MKLLRISANGFRNCNDNFVVDLVAKSKKTSEDKEYELLELDEGLYVYSTVAIVGKNASGKTTTLELIDWCYDILSTFSLADKKCSYKGIGLEIIFYNNGYIYRYVTDLDDSNTLEDKARFKNQKVYRKKYYKSNVKQIYSKSSEEQIIVGEDIPEDFSLIYFVLKKAAIREIYYDTNMDNIGSFGTTFKLMEFTKIDYHLINYILKIFDENITELKQLEEKNYSLKYRGKLLQFTDKELYRFLSSGTTKGINLYVTAIISLKMGYDLIVDEIENHFHKTLVDNLIMLYKDKQVNKKNATLVFTTHYCELLDLFNRSDNIMITHSKGKIEIENMYEKYGLRTELLKSKKFYQNAFDTAVNYDALMELKRELMQ